MERIGNHIGETRRTEASYLAITLTADLVDQLKGWAWAFHSATKVSKRSVIIAPAAQIRLNALPIRPQQ
jgi:hypothetical protein